MRDVAVSELREMIDGSPDTGGVIEEHPAAPRTPDWTSQGDGRHLQLVEQARAWIPPPHVRQNEAIHLAGLGQAPIHVGLPADVGDHTQQHAGLGRREALLDTGQKTREERVARQQMCGAGMDEADGEGSGVGQGATSGVREPSQFVSRPFDVGARCVGYARAIVQRIGSRGR